MTSDLSTQMTALQGARTQYSPQIALVKKNAELEAAAATMVEEAVRPAPPPSGMGTRVDKTA